MQPVADLVKGVEVLQPFLAAHLFAFDKYENRVSSGGQSSSAFFVKENKTFVIGYRYSVGVLYYQFERFQVEHSFYLDYLGFANEKQFPDFQSEDKLLAFRHILHDLHFMINDFLKAPAFGSQKLLNSSRQCLINIAVVYRINIDTVLME